MGYGAVVLIYIAIGANLPNEAGREPVQSCREAAARLAALPGLRLDALSHWYDSAPVPASDQPRYINGIAALEGAVPPAWLLGALQRIESQAGRVRGALNAARVLDLDIVDMGGLLRDGPDPVLPHPRAHLRAFVLYPLRDIAPGWVHPRLGTPIDALIAALPAADIGVLGG